jgi:hypothetical protein
MNAEEQKAHDEAVARAREANSKRNNERLSRIEAIADTNDEGRSSDFEEEALVIKDDSEDREARAAAEDEEAKEYAKKLQTEGAEEEDDKAEESDTKVTNGVTYYRQIVNGTEKWQSLDEIRRTASKVESGDEYLRLASESVRNASRLALSKQDETSRVEEDDLAEILRAAVLGDDDAIKKLASAIKTRPSEVTPDVVRQIDQRLSFRTELAQLESKSSDLLEDKYMGRLFRDRLNELKAENPNMQLSEAYTSIDKELRTAFPARARAKTTDKLERKRTLVNVPTSAARQQVDPEDEEGEEDVQSVINGMAIKRGQAQAVPHPRTR